MSAVANCLAANPDISGIGVRLAVYAQTFLSFAPAFLFTADGELDIEEEKVLFAIYTPLLMSSMALLATTVFQQVASRGLGNHHVLLVLKMMWMMNISAVVVCVAPTLAWFQRPVSMLPKTWSDTTEPSEVLKYVKERYLLFWWPRRTRQFLEVLLVSLCITGMSVLGLWHWNVLHIGGLNGALDPSQCFNQIQTTFLFASMPITNEIIRKLSLVFYAFMLPPVINVGLMVIFINVLEWSLVTPAKKLWHSHCNAISGPADTGNPDALGPSPPITRSSTGISHLQLNVNIEPISKAGPPSPSTVDRMGKRLYDFLLDSHTPWLEFFPLKHFLAISFPLLIALQTAIDIEISIDLNLRLMDDLEEERWTFGQVLALFLVIAPALRVAQIFFEQTPLGSYIRRCSDAKKGHRPLDPLWFIRALLTKNEWHSLHGTISKKIFLARFACGRLQDTPNIVAYQGVFTLEWHLLLAESQLEVSNLSFTAPNIHSNITSDTTADAPSNTKSLQDLSSELESSSEGSIREMSNDFEGDPLKLLKISLISARDSVSIAQSVRFTDVREHSRYQDGALMLACLMDTLYSALRAVERFETERIFKPLRGRRMDTVAQSQRSFGFGPLKSWILSLAASEPGMVSKGDTVNARGVGEAKDSSSEST
ncbi:hypothetical protein VNI00_003753 [Paramarasmius palmivorus]|uniref:Uncharacterized protein n=1 Tax=Paramarasmius palmivorus TaxID=297713 RepID=A0AAW0DT61_9AGAR